MIPNLKLECAYFMDFVGKYLFLRFCAYFDKLFKIKTFTSFNRSKKENTIFVMQSYVPKFTKKLITRYTSNYRVGKITLFLENMIARNSRIHS